MSHLLDAALDYAAKGWPVFPVADKKPLVKSWPVEASLDADQVRAWWSKWPDAAIGLAAGERSGWWVLDVDVDAGGEVSLSQLEAQHGALPPTLTVRTGGGGRHFYWAMTAPMRNRQAVVKGIDVRATGGYVVAPPSPHASGFEYEVLDESPLAPAPAWLLEMVLPKAPARPAPYVAPVVTEQVDVGRRFVANGLVGACQDIVGAGQGQRHKVLYAKAVKMGGYIVNGYIDEATVVAELQRAGEASGKDAREVARVITDGLKVGHGRPLHPDLKAPATSSSSSSSPSRDEVLAYWAEHPELSSMDVGDYFGIGANVLRNWKSRHGIPVAVVHQPEVHQGAPVVHPEVHHGAPLVQGGAHQPAPVVHPAPHHGAPVVHQTEEERVHQSDPIQTLAQVLDAVRLADTAGDRVAKLGSLAEDVAWLQAMSELPETATTAQIARIAAVRGGNRIASAIERDLRQRRKAVEQLAKRAAALRPRDAHVLDISDAHEWPRDRNGAHPAVRDQLAMSINPLTGSAKPRQCYDNVYLVLLHDPRWGERLRRDELTGNVTWWSEPFSIDRDGSSTVAWLGKHYDLHPGLSAVKEALTDVAHRHRFHPVRDYLSTLPEWDGVSRVERILTDVLHCEDRAIHQAFIRRTLVAAVARVMEPGCQVDTALVMVGPQGIRKSTFFRTLFGGAWFNDSELHPGDKDAYMKINRVWAYEWAEFDKAQRYESGVVKNFVSGREDRFRPPYAREEVSWKRTSIIVATTNERSFLTDPSGHRRYYVLYVPSVIDIDLVEDWRDQLWAEAKALYLAGEKVFLTAEEEEERIAVVSEYVVRDERAELVDAWLHGRALVGVTVAEVAVEVLKMELRHVTMSEQRVIGNILRSLGWEKRYAQKEHSRGWRWYKAEAKVAPPRKPVDYVPTDSSGVVY